MASIEIKNVGPLADTGQIDLGRFNVIIGKQSTGKSTFMKILCFCQWLEKKIMTGDDKQLIYNYTHYHRFLKELRQFHRFPNHYFTPQSLISYSGEAVTIELQGNKNVKIGRQPDLENIRHNTKLSFIPSERNLATALKNVDRVYKSYELDVLFNHLFEWDEARENYTEEHPVELNIIGNMDYYYDPNQGDVIHLKDKRRKISPFYVSSGVQSVLPIVAMTHYFTGPIFVRGVDLSKNDVAALFRKLSQMPVKESQDADFLLNKLANIYTYQNTRLFIEEPEQNLFPESQQALINFIVERINTATRQTGKPSSVVITTHSPYIITAFNVLLKAARAEKIDADATYKVVPKNAIIHSCVLHNGRRYAVEYSGRRGANDRRNGTRPCLGYRRRQIIPVERRDLWSSRIMIFVPSCLPPTHRNRN